MDITKMSIKKPIALLMVVCIVILLGMVSLMNLPIDLMPNMNIPYIIVMTNYSGAGPREVESMVTIPLERAISTVQNVKLVQSQSSEGSSIVLVEFADGTDLNFASLDLRERIDMVKGMLPDGTGTPTVMKLDLNSMPIASVTVTGDMNQQELKSQVEDKIQPRIERLEGVASVDLSGGRDKEIKIVLDVDKINGMGVNVNQIISTLMAENYNQAGGKIDYGDLSFNVRTQGEFLHVDQIAGLPIMMGTGGFVYLRDIATVEEVYKDIASYARIDGRESIVLSLQKSTDSNIVAAMRNVKDEMTKLEEEFPEFTFGLVNDQSEFIEFAIASVVDNLVIGAILAVIILIIFLKSFGLTLVISLSIPISVISTFVLIYFSGTTLNMISLGGLALGVGMLVDNSIVVMENIYRYRHEGFNRIDASYQGTKEVRGAVIASTLTTVVVFLPIIFTDGLIIQIFQDMALTVSFSLLSSLVVAITLVPMMCAVIVRKMDVMRAPKFLGFLNVFIDMWDKAIDRINDVYKNVLAWVMRHRKFTVLVAVVTFAGSLALIPFTGLEFIPVVDEGGLSITVDMPDGTRLEETNAAILFVEEIAAQIPEMDTVMSTVSAESGSVTCQLVGMRDRTRSTKQVAEDIRMQIQQIPGADISISETGSMMGGAFGGSGIAYEVSGAEFDMLESIANQMVQIVESVEGTREVTTSLSEGRHEVQITVDRDRASMVGLTASQIASSVRLALEGRVATKLKQDGVEIDVRVTYPDSAKDNIEQLRGLILKTPMGGDIPLSSLANLEIVEGPTSIMRSNQMRLVNVSASVLERDLGTVDAEVRAKLDTLALPDGYAYEVGGQMELLDDAVESLLLMFVMAICLVYMVMAAQFESLLYPFIIMFSIPLATTGSLLLMFITRTPFSTPALIGAVMLVGIVVNNAIVLVDYINILRKEREMSVTDAVLEAGPKRLRPILMTALTTILALIPMVLSTADGAELQKPLALMVMGGLVSSTVLTLVVVPVLYIYFDGLSNRIKGLFHKKTKKEEASV